LRGPLAVFVVSPPIGRHRRATTGTHLRDDGHVALTVTVLLLARSAAVTDSSLRECSCGGAVERLSFEGRGALLFARQAAYGTDVLLFSLFRRPVCLSLLDYWKTSRAYRRAASKDSLLCASQPASMPACQGERRAEDVRQVARRAESNERGVRVARPRLFRASVSLWRTSTDHRKRQDKTRRRGWFTQFLAGMRTLKRREAIRGVLTDGNEWSPAKLTEDNVSHRTDPLIVGYATPNRQRLYKLSSAAALSQLKKTTRVLILVS